MTIDRLRGPNPVPKLFALVENSVEVYSREYAKWEGPWYDTGFEMLRTAHSLQGWARSIDQAVIQASLTSSLTDRFSLEEIVNEMTKTRRISSDLDILSVEKPHEPQGSVLLGGALPSQMNYPWMVIKSLFDIDTSEISEKRYKARIKRVNSQHYRKYDGSNHEYMLRLIGAVVERKGYKIENTTIPEQTNDLINAYSIPSDIEGVSFILSLLNNYTAAAWVNEEGINIWNIALRFTASFLTDVRPLTDKEYQKYTDTEQRLRDKVEQDKKQTYGARLSGSKNKSDEKSKVPNVQNTYEQKYAQELAAIRRLRRNFSGTATDWTNMCPPDGLVPPWIWYDVYRGK